MNMEKAAKFGFTYPHVYAQLPTADDCYMVAAPGITVLWGVPGRRNTLSEDGQSYVSTCVMPIRVKIPGYGTYEITHRCDDSFFGKFWLEDDPDREPELIAVAIENFEPWHAPNGWEIETLYGVTEVPYDEEDDDWFDVDWLVKWENGLNP